MATASEEPKTITVSRDALRADLAELRGGFQKDLGDLQNWMRDQLETKANVKAFEKLQEDVGKLGRDVSRIDTEGSREAQQALHAVEDLRAGTLPDGMKLAVGVMIDDKNKAKGDRGWTSWTRIAGVLMLLIAVGTITLAVVLAAHNWGVHSP